MHKSLEGQRSIFSKLPAQNSEARIEPLHKGTTISEMQLVLNSGIIYSWTKIQEVEM